MYKSRDLGYNRWAMAATTPPSPDPLGRTRARRGHGASRAIAIVFSLVVAFVVVDAFVGDRGLAALVRTRQEYAALASEVAARRAENDRLLEQVRRLRAEDPTVIEEIARRDLGLIRPGERLFIIHDISPSARK